MKTITTIGIDLAKNSFSVELAKNSLCGTLLPMGLCVLVCLPGLMGLSLLRHTKVTLCR
jgi:hypothetical protein